MTLGTLLISYNLTLIFFPPHWIHPYISWLCFLLSLTSEVLTFWSRGSYFPSHPCVQWWARSCFSSLKLLKGLVHTSCHPPLFHRTEVNAGVTLYEWLFTRCRHSPQWSSSPAAAYWLLLMTVSLKTPAWTLCSNQLCLSSVRVCLFVSMPANADYPGVVV